MKFRNVAFLTLLVAAPVFSAQAESTDVLADKLIEVSRLYQAEDSQGRTRLKPTLEEISKQGDAYLSEVASLGEKPSAPLVDASHQVKQLLHS